MVRMQMRLGICDVIFRGTIPEFQSGWIFEFKDPERIHRVLGYTTGYSKR